MIKDRIIRSEKIDWQNIKTLQPDNFKIPEQQEVLKKSIMGNGFVSPFCVWEDAEGVIWSIDGVHRIKALKELQEQGEGISKLLTANFIDAKTRKEAGIILLEVFNTKQNKATEDGVELLKIDLGIRVNDLHVDATDLDFSYLATSISESELESFFEEDSQEKEIKNKIILEYTEEEFALVNEKFNKFKGQSKEQTVYKLLNL